MATLKVSQVNRIENKKRKLTAFLELVSDKIEPPIFPSKRSLKREQFALRQQELEINNTTTNGTENTKSYQTDNNPKVPTHGIEKMTIDQTKVLTTGTENRKIDETKKKTKVSTIATKKKKINETFNIRKVSTNGIENRKMNTSPIVSTNGTACNTEKAKAFNVQSNDPSLVKRSQFCRKVLRIPPVKEKTKPVVGLGVETLKELRMKVKQYTSGKSKPPAINVKKHSKCYSLENPFKNPDMKIMQDKYTDALNVKDIEDLILYALLGANSQTKPLWCNAGNLQAVRNVTMVVVDNVSVEDFYQHSSLFKKSGIHFYFFEMMRLVVMKSFPEDFCDTEPQIEKGGSESFVKATKMDLLLSPVQMMLENYPIPEYVTDTSRYVFTKDRYEKVNNSSPMFGLDCEMCVTVREPSALTRISIVDESLRVIYDTLVQPPSKIINYLTQYSGITAPMMRGVTTTLEDVQNEIRNNLPADAILVGQSLNSDLIALKLVHPYVIDTGIIYNLHGQRRTKTSLKNLTAKFLKEAIQTGTAGHDSIEDSAYALKLVQLKLEKYLNFGDVILGYQEHKETNLAPAPIRRERVFDKILRFKKKQICLLGNEECLLKYSRNVEDIKQMYYNDMEDVKQNMLEEMYKHQLTISNLTASFPLEESLPEIDNFIAQIYEKRPRNSLTVVVFTGIKLNGKISAGLVIPMV